MQKIFLPDCDYHLQNVLKYSNITAYESYMENCDSHRISYYYYFSQMIEKLNKVSKNGNNRAEYKKVLIEYNKILNVKSNLYESACEELLKSDIIGLDSELDENEEDFLNNHIKTLSCFYLDTTQFIKYFVKGLKEKEPKFIKLRNYLMQITKESSRCTLCHERSEYYDINENIGIDTNQFLIKALVIMKAEW